MFGFTKVEMEVLGSEGRFKKRIEKFRSRNRLEKSLYKIHLETLKNIEEELKKEDCTDEHRKWCAWYIESHKDEKKPFFPLHPVIEHHFWWLTHNWLAHFLIGLVPVKAFFDFHDWTSRKLNAQ